MELYAWQKECLERWEDRRFRGIVQAVTGSGKTALALGMRTDASGKFEKNIDPMLTLPAVNRALYTQVKEVLDENKAQRHIRGGIATRKKYKGV